MTITNTTRKAGPYNGDGVVIAFAFAFKTFAAADILVVLTDSAGTETTQTLTTHYTVTLNADQNVSPGGTVSMVTAPAVGETLTLGSVMSETQPTEIRNQGPFLPKVLENMVDRNAISIQQNSEKIDRAILLKRSSAHVNLEFPEPVASTFLRWNSGATALENITLANVDVLLVPGTTVIGNIVTFDNVTGTAIKDSGVNIIDGKLILGHTASITVGLAANNFLQVHSTVANGLTITRWNNAIGGGNLTFGKSRNTTIGANTAVTSGDNLGIIQGAGDDGTDLNTVAAIIAFDCEGTIAENQIPGKITFKTANSSGTVIEALRLDSSQNATFAENVSVATGKVFQVNGVSTLTATALGSAVVNSSLTKVGTITTGVWSGTVIVTGKIATTLTGKTLTTATLVSPIINTGVSGTAILDEDNMASNSATKLATQQSIKAYADALPGIGTYPAFSVHRNGVQQSNITGTEKIRWTTEEFDTNGDFEIDADDSGGATESRFTPTVAGKYLLSAALEWFNLTSGDQIFIYIYKNGSAFKEVRLIVAGTASTVHITVVVNANGSSDYFEVFTKNNQRNTASISTLAGQTPYFTGCRIN